MIGVYFGYAVGFASFLAAFFTPRLANSIVKKVSIPRQIYRNILLVTLTVVLAAAFIISGVAILYSMGLGPD